MMGCIRHLSRDGYTAMPWRNGAGTTREIAREPEHGEHFAWRLSLASLEVSGPFSSYQGYRRMVALLEGNGFRLGVKGARADTLSVRGAHAFFPGVAETTCELLDGPCTDLSLMVREPGRIDAVARLEMATDHTWRSPPAAMQALFVLCGAVDCYVPMQSAAGHAPRERPYRLNVHDTLLADTDGASWSACRAPGDAAELLVITFSPPSHPLKSLLTP